MKAARLTLEGLLLQHLAGGLVLKLVILAQEVLAVVTAEDAATVTPHLLAPHLLVTPLIELHYSILFA